MPPAKKKGPGKDGGGAEAGKAAPPLASSPEKLEKVRAAGQTSNRGATPGNKKGQTSNRGGKGQTSNRGGKGSAGAAPQKGGKLASVKEDPKGAQATGGATKQAVDPNAPTKIVSSLDKQGANQGGPGGGKKIDYLTEELMCVPPARAPAALSLS